jgi:hypothetical protein
MDILDSIGNYVVEGVNEYKLHPMDFYVNGASFEVRLGEDPMAQIFIKTNNDANIDALVGNFEYEDIHVDIIPVNEIESPNNSEIIQWIANKFKALRFIENPIRVNGVELYKYEPKIYTEPTIPEDKEEDVTETPDEDKDKDNDQSENDMDNSEEDVSDDSDDIEFDDDDDDIEFDDDDDDDEVDND